MKKGIFFLFTLFALVIGLLQFPNLFISKSFEYKSFKIYSNNKIVFDQSVKNLLDSVLVNLDESHFRKKDDRYELYFIRGSWYEQLIGFFGRKKIASSRYMKQVYTAYPDFRNGILTRNTSEHEWLNLAQTISHESVHSQMYADHSVLGFIQTPTWINEGYCEYISYRPVREASTYRLSKIANLLDTQKANWLKTTHGARTPRTYLRDRLLIEYLIDFKGMTIEEIIANKSLQPDELYAEIIQYFKENQQPKISFTFDDGSTNDILHLPFEKWNEMILTSLDEAQLKAIFFVSGFNKLDQKGQFLLKTWNDRGHQIANHTFSHPNFNDKNNSVNDFEIELLQTDSIISKYENHIDLFRFPYLKEGNSREKIDSIRHILNKHQYTNGHVTIDASDWYVNSQLIKKIKKVGLEKTPIDQYQDFYIQHLFDRANYYEDLSFKINKRHISHTLLLHHNLTSALFLDDLIKKFKTEGWQIINADVAYDDPIFRKTPSTVPAGESLIWSLGKESGKYETILRYPAEDSRYEAPKMKKLSL